MTDPLKQAFLVVGAESSGTRLLTSLLIAGGCHGSAEHIQPFDTGEGGFGEVSPIVWRRSVPHNTDWWAWVEALDKLLDSRYVVTVLVTARNYVPCIKSQISVGLSADWIQGKHRVASALGHIFTLVSSNWLLDFHWGLVTYESLRSEDERRSILKFHGLDPNGADKVQVRDENRKHW